MKVTQIATGEMNGVPTVYGLGDDGKLYLWNPFDGTWNFNGPQD